MSGMINGVVRFKRAIVVATLLLSVIFTICFLKVKINYNMTDYLPENANSTKALRMMEDEFGEAIPNCSVMVKNLDLTEALEVRHDLEKIKGIESVNWLDDVVDLQKPLEIQDKDTIDDYYKDGDALYSVTITDGEERATIERIEAKLGEGIYLSGTAVEQAESQKMAVKETVKAICIIGPLIILILLLATNSWLEPFIYLTAIGGAVLINLGSEIFRGEISYVTLAVAPLLQMACSLDYAVFLSNSYKKQRLTAVNDTEAMKLAMKDSLKSVMASALTTIFGFLALTMMNFRIGPDMGISLVKGIILSLIACMTFLPAAILLLNKWIDKTRHKNFMPDFKGPGKVAVRIAVPAFVLVAALVIFCYPAQKMNDFTYGSGDVATKEAKVIEDTFGTKNTMVLMVPKNDRTSEKLMCEEIEGMPYVTEVLSYTTQVGAEIPPEYLAKDIQGNFYGESYARIIIYSSLPDESEASFKLMKNVRSIAEKYYGEDVYSCGQSANLYDMKHTVESDNKIVNLVTILAIYLILLFMTKSWFLPIPLILTIKCAIWVNMAIPYFTGTSLVYLGYLVVSTVQMGATIDYAILLTDNYMKNRKEMPLKKALQATMTETIPAVLVSAFVLAIAGFALALVSTNGIVVSLGILIGRGALLPLIMVNLFLPALLIFADKIIPATTWKASFFRGEASEDRVCMENKKYVTKHTVKEFLGADRIETYDDREHSF